MNAIDYTPGNSGRPHPDEEAHRRCRVADGRAGGRGMGPPAGGGALHHLRAEVRGAEASLLLP